MTEKLLAELEKGEELSIGKLAMFQAMISNNGIDLNAIIQARLLDTMFAEDK